MIKKILLLTAYFSSGKIYSSNINSNNTETQKQYFYIGGMWTSDIKKVFTSTLESTYLVNFIKPSNIINRAISRFNNIKTVPAIIDKEIDPINRAQDELLKQIILHEIHKVIYVNNSTPVEDECKSEEQDQVEFKKNQYSTELKELYSNYNITEEFLRLKNQKRNKKLPIEWRDTFGLIIKDLSNNSYIANYIPKQKKHYILTRYECNKNYCRKSRNADFVNQIYDLEKKIFLTNMLKYKTDKDNIGFIERLEEDSANLNLSFSDFCKKNSINAKILLELYGEYECIKYLLKEVFANLSCCKTLESALTINTNDYFLSPFIAFKRLKEVVVVESKNKELQKLIHHYEPNRKGFQKIKACIILLAEIMNNKGIFYQRSKEEIDKLLPKFVIKENNITYASFKEYREKVVRTLEKRCGSFLELQLLKDRFLFIDKLDLSKVGYQKAKEISEARENRFNNHLYKMCNFYNDAKMQASKVNNNDNYYEKSLEKQAESEGKKDLMLKQLYQRIFQRKLLEVAKKFQQKELESKELLFKREILLLNSLLCSELPCYKNFFSSQRRINKYERSVIGREKKQIEIMHKKAVKILFETSNNKAHNKVELKIEMDNPKLKEEIDAQWKEIISQIRNQQINLKSQLRSIIYQNSNPKKDLTERLRLVIKNNLNLYIEIKLDNCKLLQGDLILNSIETKLQECIQSMAMEKMRYNKERGRRSKIMKQGINSNIVKFQRMKEFILVISTVQKLCLKIITKQDKKSLEPKKLEDYIRSEWRDSRSKEVCQSFCQSKKNAYTFNLLKKSPIKKITEPLLIFFLDQEYDKDGLEKDLACSNYAEDSFIIDAFLEEGTSNEIKDFLYKVLKEVFVKNL